MIDTDCMPEAIEESVDWVDRLFKLGMFFIGLSNFIVAIMLFRLKNRREDRDKEQDRKLSLFKTLILDHHLDKFYGFFDDLHTQLRPLLLEDSDEVRKSVNDELLTLFIALRQQFYDTFIAIDKTLHEQFASLSDALQDELTEVIFDKGSKLTHLPKYEEEIINRISGFKNQMISLIFHYRGKS